MTKFDRSFSENHPLFVLPPGLCPQHDVLYDTLTVKEHLWFFGSLKGLTRDEAGGEIDKMMESIKLTDKSNAQTRYLSGGMKRKLSLGLALVGKAKVSGPSYDHILSLQHT